LKNAWRTELSKRKIYGSVSKLLVDGNCDDADRHVNDDAPNRPLPLDHYGDAKHFSV
jgi:hypothetical protein